MSKNIVTEATKLAGSVVVHETEVVGLSAALKKEEEMLANTRERIKALRGQIDPAKTRLAESQGTFTSFIETIEVTSMRPRVRDAALAAARAQHDLDRGVAPEAGVAVEPKMRKKRAARAAVEAAATATAADAARPSGGEPVVTEPETAPATEPLSAQSGTAPIEPTTTSGHTAPATEPLIEPALAAEPPLESEAAAGGVLEPSAAMDDATAGAGAPAPVTAEDPFKAMFGVNN